MSQLAYGYAMSDGVAGVLKTLCGGLPGGPAQTQVRPWRFFHRLAYAAAGNAVLTFFNVGATPFVSNWPQAGQLANNYGFALQTIGVKIYSGVDINGAAVAAGALSAATQQAAIYEQLRLAHETCQAKVLIGDKTIADVYDVTALPPGRGMDFSVAAVGTAAAITIGTVNNSAPLWANRHMFDTPWPISGGQSVSVTLNWASATSAPLTGGGVAMVELCGLLCSPAGT